MSRATGPEAVRTGKEVLLIHRLQHHDDCSLRPFIFEGRDTELPTRAIRLRNICPTHWRRYVATRLDAIQKVQEIGFQVCRIVVRRHTVDARSTILAGESGSPTSQVILRCYDFPARIPGHLFVSLPGSTLPSSFRVSQLALALLEGRRGPSGP